MMDSAYVPALAALAGSVIGGLNRRRSSHPLHGMKNELNKTCATAHKFRPARKRALPHGRPWVWFFSALITNSLALSSTESTARPGLGGYSSCTRHSAELAKRPGFHLARQIASMDFHRRLADV
jgi:hypothetical protein